MTYQTFEDTPVWREAARLYELTADLLENAAFKVRSGFADQLERAALSVSNNIAEGFERGTTNELIYFLYVARGSSGETRSMLRLKLRRTREPALATQINQTIECAVSCSKQIRGWADSLQNSPIAGVRHLNDRTRKESDQKRRAAECSKKMLSMLSPGHPMRKDAEARGII